MTTFIVDDFTDFHDLTIETPDGVTRFAFSKRFGPTLLGKRGDWIERKPALRDKFWAALHYWCIQGHRIEHGRCVYDLPSKPHYYSPDGKNFVLDTPENREKWAAYVNPQRECTGVEDAWSTDPKPRIIKTPIYFQSELIQ